MKLFRIWLMAAKKSKNAVSILHEMPARHTGGTTERHFYRMICFQTLYTKATTPSVYCFPIGPDLDEVFRP
jgi:hypothetical protein